MVCVSWRLEMVCWLRAGVDIIPPTVSTNMSRSVLSTLVRSCGKHHALCVGGSNVSASMRPVAVPLLSSLQFQQVRFMGKERANKAIKPGETLIIDGELNKVVKYIQGKRGKGGGFVRATLKNILTSSVFEKTFTSDEVVETAELEKVAAQYSWSDADNHVFMTQDTFEEVLIPVDDIDSEYLADGLEVSPRTVILRDL
jgi:translation elongation factor P/translation initiation factor 5A